MRGRKLGEVALLGWLRYFLLGHQMSSLCPNTEEVQTEEVRLVLPLVGSKDSSFNCANVEMQQQFQGLQQAKKIKHMAYKDGNEIWVWTMHCQHLDGRYVCYNNMIGKVKWDVEFHLVQSTLAYASIFEPFWQCLGFCWHKLLFLHLEQCLHGLF